MKSQSSSLNAAVIFFCALSIVCSQKYFERAHDVCLKRHDITRSELMTLKDDDGDMDKKFKCFAHCIIKEVGYLDESGKLSAENIEKTHKMSDRELSVVEECKAQHDLEDDPCEYGYQMMGCYIKAD